MPEVSRIPWTELPGNKFSKALDSAMYHPEGYIIMQNVRDRGEPKPTAYQVVYTPDYLVNWMISKVIRPLAPQGIDRLHQLVDQAWNEYHGTGLANDEPQVTNYQL